MFDKLKTLIKFEIEDKEAVLDAKIGLRVEQCKASQGFKKCSECKDHCLIRKFEGKWKP